GLNANRAAGATRAAGAADADIDRVIGGRSGSTEAAIAATSTDRLRQNAGGAQALRQHRDIAVDHHITAGAAIAAGATNRNGNAGAGAPRALNGKAAIAAAAADRLRQHAASTIAGGLDHRRDVMRDTAEIDGKIGEIDRGRATRSAGAPVA